MSEMPAQRDILHSQLHHLLRLGILQVDYLPTVGMLRMVVIWRRGCEFN